MSAAWRIVRVFISSTFRDMHAERDWLVKRVFPALRERLEPHRIHLVDIDLRWGVTKDQADNDEALDICLTQIDECRPYFLGILGERYGWVSDQVPDRVISKWGWVRHHLSKSITELEILYGVLNNPAMHAHALFCMREPVFLSDVPAGRRADLEAEGPDHAAKLATLKQAIRDSKLALFENYPCRYAGLRLNLNLLSDRVPAADRAALAAVARDRIVRPAELAGLDPRLRQVAEEAGTVHLDGLEEFGRRILEWLWEAIRREHNLGAASSAEAAPDSLAEELGYHERFLESRVRVYIGRESLQASLTAFAEGTGEEPCLITGPSGSGKSAALARFALGFAAAHPQAIVVPHFVGASPASTSLRAMLLRLCGVLKREFALPDEVPADTNGLITAFRQIVEKVPADRRVVLILDALNQLDEADNAQRLTWLPWKLPGNVKLILSCIADPGRDEPVLQGMANRPHRANAVEPLTPGEQDQILRAVPSLSAKTLDDLQVRLLLANPTAANPLFLLVALEELRGFGSFEQLDPRIARFPRPAEDRPGWSDWLRGERAGAAALPDARKRDERLRRLDRIEAALRDVTGEPDPVTALFLQVIDRLEGEFDPVAARDLLALLASARRGLSDRELLDMLEGTGVAVADSRGDLFPVLRQLRPYLQHRGPLRDFFHRNLFKAVRERYLAADADRSAGHARLAAYFGAQDYFLESLEDQRARAKRLPPTPRPANVRKVDELPYQLLEVAKLSGKDDPASPHWDAVADLFTDLHFLEAKAEAVG